MRRAAVLLLLMAAAPAFAEERAPSVFDARGAAQVLGLGQTVWKPAAAGTQLVPGSRLRTGKGAGLLIGLDAELETLAYLGEDTEFRVDAAGTWRLERGKLFWMREPSSHPGDAGRPSPGPRQVDLQGLSVSLDAGGCALTALPDGSGTVRVFGGAALSGERRIVEGYKLMSSTKAASAKVMRLDYEDYKDWQVLIRYFYEKRDDLVADRVEKEEDRL